MRPILIFGLCMIGITTRAAPAACQIEASHDGQPTASSVRQYGQRETHSPAAANGSPTMRVANRVQNRVQTRIQNRIDRDSYRQNDTTTAIDAASNQARTAGRQLPVKKY